jgi:hypothetical protein
MLLLIVATLKGRDDRMTTQGAAPARMLDSEPVKRVCPMKISLPPELESAVKTASKSVGATPEQVVLAILRERLCASAMPSPSASEGHLGSFLEGFIGTIDGSAEALSERSGERFGDGLERDRADHEQRARS